MPIKRWSVVLTALALAAPGLTAQEEAARDADREPTAERPIPAGVYAFVPEESEEIDEKVREAVSHIFFAVRGIARRRLAGANRPIERVVIDYQGDTLLISLRDDEPTVRTLMNGEYLPYTREDGEVVQVGAYVEPGMVDMSFDAEDGKKKMIYQLRDDEMLAVESIIYSDRLEEPFGYTWVYERTEDDGETEGL